MYWLLDYAEQENLRQRMIHLQSTILNRQPRDQSEQIFPFIGRKSRTIARTLIENLTDENGLVVDPFGMGLVHLHTLLLMLVVMCDLMSGSRTPIKCLLLRFVVFHLPRNIVQLCVLLRSG